MILKFLEIGVAALLIIVILLQMQGTGLSAGLGGSGEMFRSKRSMDKFLTYGTVVLAFLFGLISILLLIYK